MEETLAGIARIAIGGVLLIAGAAKLRSGHSRFLAAVLGYDLLKGRAADLFARALPCVEVGLGVALVLGIAPVPTVAATLILLATVTAAVANSLVRGRSHHCACVGFTWERVTSVQWPIVFRNWLIAVALAAVAWLEGGSLAACRAIGGCSVAPGAMVAFNYAASGLVVAWAMAVAVLRVRNVLTRRRGSLSPPGIQA